MTFAPKTLTGRIVHLKEGGEQWGRERFSMSVWDKGRAMRAVTEFDDRKVMREASWSVGADWSAREAFTREVIDGELMSHCWFRVDGETVDCEAFSKAMGRVSQRLEVGRRVDYLGLHTILADVLVAAARGCTEPGVEKPVTCVTNSVGDYGVGGYYAQAVSPLVTYIGPDEIDVRAGRFTGEHFRVRWSDLTPHYSDFWVTQGDFLPLRLLGAFGPVSYELAELDLG
jgi:hypothetical protein